MKHPSYVIDQTKVLTVNNALEVREKLEELMNEGYAKGNLFVITHDDRRTDNISEHTDAEKIGILEEGPITAIANLFRSRGDELRAKLRSVGISKEHAEQLERELDKGLVVIVAWGGTLFDNNDYDRQITYYWPWV
jgi:hypothetical protein